MKTQNCILSRCTITTPPAMCNVFSLCCRPPHPHTTTNHTLLLLSTQRQQYVLFSSKVWHVYDSNCYSPDNAYLCSGKWIERSSLHWDTLCSESHPGTCLSLERSWRIRRVFLECLHMRTFLLQYTHIYALTTHPHTQHAHCSCCCCLYGVTNLKIIYTYAHVVTTKCVCLLVCLLQQYASNTTCNYIYIYTSFIVEVVHHTTHTTHTNVFRFYSF
jgi:hypothetical protein